MSDINTNTNEQDANKQLLLEQFKELNKNQKNILSKMKDIHINSPYTVNDNIRPESKICFIFSCPGKNERHFLDNEIVKIPSGNKFHYWYFIDPIGKTQKEIGKQLFKRFKEKGYMIIRLILFALIIGFGTLLLVKSYNSNKIMINTIVTSPILLLFMLCNFFPKSASYLTTIYPDYSFIDAIHWEDCICPNCGVLVDPKATTVSNKNTTNWKSQSVGKSTDKYSAGNVTVYVETTHVAHHDHTNRSWKENHYCPKCKTTFSKKNGYTYTETH